MRLISQGPPCHQRGTSRRQDTNSSAKRVNRSGLCLLNPARMNSPKGQSKPIAGVVGWPYCQDPGNTLRTAAARDPLSNTSKNRLPQESPSLRQKARSISAGAFLVPKESAENRPSAAESLLLLVPQRHHGIDFRRAAGGPPSGEEARN